MFARMDIIEKKYNNNFLEGAPLPFWIKYWLSTNVTDANNNEEIFVDVPTTSITPG